MTSVRSRSKCPHCPARVIRVDTHIHKVHKHLFARDNNSPDIFDDEVCMDPAEVPNQCVNVSSNSVPNQCVNVSRNSVPNQCVNVSSNSMPNQCVNVSSDSVPNQCVNVSSNKVPNQCVNVSSNFGA